MSAYFLALLLMIKIEKCPLGGTCDFNEGEIIRFAASQHPFDKIFGKNGEDASEMEECLSFCNELRSRIFDVMRSLAQYTKDIDPAEIDAIQKDDEQVRGWISKKESQPINDLRASV